MKRRLPSRLAIGLACATLGAAAWATDAGTHAGTDKQSAQEADRTQVVPDKGDLTPYKPSTEVLDDNTQRAHDRDQAATASKGTPDAAATGTQDAQARTKPEGQPELAYDYERMDKNGDNLISPDEMTAELNLGKSPSTSAAGTSAAPGEQAPAASDKKPASSADKPMTDADKPAEATSGQGTAR